MCFQKRDTKTVHFQENMAMELIMTRKKIINEIRIHYIPKPIFILYQFKKKRRKAEEGMKKGRVKEGKERRERESEEKERIEGRKKKKPSSLLLLFFLSIYFSQVPVLIHVDELHFFPPFSLPPMLFCLSSKQHSSVFTLGH